ncbi:hypothetical protein L1987_00956 [Smallanthus sonchifolius]|uniref:Uncharacterized protein n=1 Tax=Smallanthus sonchifolius TaxID=185202 RepID=A0ACB9K3Q3_9ASTR|nr:hypothetical protein L1987_00956 [Smallanthus sonchifolius]
MVGESKPNKPHYDITMSRRTRRARMLFGEKVSALKVEDKQVDEENEEEKRKMKFIDIFGGKQEEDECKNSLGGHFTEEDKERQLVVKHEKGLDGVSLKKMVSRCAKMWGHMIKIKGGSRKKRVLQLTM